MFAVAVQPDPRLPLIRTLRKNKRISLRWLAEAVGSNHTTVSSWLEGDVKPHVQNAYDLLMAAVNSYPNKPGEQVEIEVLGIRRVEILPAFPPGAREPLMPEVSHAEVKDWKSDTHRWGRVVTDMALSPLLIPGDVVIFEDRPSEPGHVVHAYKDGRDVVRISKGLKQQARLTGLSDDFEDEPAAGWELRGVAVTRIRKKMRDRVSIEEFPHGMRDDDVNSL